MKNVQNYPLICGLFLLLFASGCDTKETHAASSGPKSSPIRTMTVESREIGDTLEIPAKVSADPATVVHIYPPAGGRLLEVAVRPGDHVRKGQVIAIEQSSDVAQARSDYAHARVEFERTSRALARAKLLFEHKVLSEREYEQAQAENDEAKSELDRTTAHLQILGVSVQGTSNDVNLSAPRAGAVLEIGAASGELSKSTDNANSIATIADLSTVWVVGDVYEKDLGALKTGEPVVVTLSAYPGQQWPGKLAVIYDALDPQTRTLKVRVVLSNPGEKLKPEMFASIQVRLPARTAIAVPASAVLREGGDSMVMVQTTPNAFERRLITIESSDANQVVVASGLKPGEVIVSEGAALVRGEGESQ